MEIPDIEGEHRPDSLSRQLYSTDASIYKIRPEHIFFPAHARDVQSIVSWAHKEGIPITPRGGGTSLSGQAIGRGCVVDCSRMMSQILDWNPEQPSVRVQPGVVLDQLNQYLKENGYLFGPDVATSSRANIGGMIGNNSAGAHSIRFGHTSEHIRKLTCVLSNGEKVTFEPVPMDEAEQKAQASSLEGSLYREIPPLIREHEQVIRDRYPDLTRNASGYGLDRFLESLDDGYVDFTQLVAGSEGTLATVVEAELDVVGAPLDSALLVLHCETILEAMRANRVVVKQNPYASELLDEKVLSLARDSLETSRMMDWVEGDPGALLIVEVATFDPAEQLKERMDEIEDSIRNAGFEGSLVRATTPEKQQKVWKIRKAGLPLLLGLPGNRKPTAFVEDTVVDPAELAEYVEDFQDIVRSYGTEAAFFGHSSVGCLHIRPLLDLKSAKDIENMRQMARDVTDLILEYNGVISGEHGSGRARSEWLSKMYGKEITDLYERIKTVFDPDGILNPGNIVDPEPMDENLRFGPDYSTRSFDPVQDFTEQGGFQGLVELCNGNGACRKETEGTMCPSYMVTHDEQHTTRGRANALRGLLDGDLEPEALTDGRLEQVMDLCISCKACKSECPTNVDMAPLKEEVLHKIHQENGSSLRARFFSQIGPTARLASHWQPAASWMQQLPGVETIMKSLLDIAPQRELPSFSARPFEFDQYPDQLDGQNNPLVLYVDTFNGYMEPRIARSAARVLEALDYDLIVPRFPCCGRPMMSKGFLDQAQEQANQTMDRLEPFVEAGVPIVGLEPSCVSALTDDYRRFVPGDRADRLAELCEVFSEFLIEREEFVERWPGRTLDSPVLIHGHCHQKALFGSSGPRTLWSHLSDGDVEFVDSGCCGMAGSFGFETEHYDISRDMAFRRLIPAIEDRPKSSVIASGTSCRQQIEEFTRRDVHHPAVVLADLLD